MITRAGASLIASLTLAGAGCAVPVLTTVDHKVRFDGTSPDAIVVFGFAARLNVWLFPGTDDGVNFRCHAGRANARRFQPEEGFVVARLPARTGKNRYAIGAISTDIFQEVHGPPANAAVWVFNAEPGKVTYLGALRVVWSDGRPQFLDDSAVKEAAADDFVTRTFPNIPVHVVSRRMESAYMSMSNPDGCLDWQGARHL